VRLVIHFLKLLFISSHREVFVKPALSRDAIKEKITELPEVSVSWIWDGDTVLVSKGWWNEITLRLDAIDCPEDGQYWGDRAKYGLMKLIAKKRVRIEEHGIETYGRTLATIYVWDTAKNEWTNVNEKMVMLGHAWVMRRYYNHLPKDRQDTLNRLERWAKSKGVGLWHASNPIPPWEWRNLKRPTRRNIVSFFKR